MTLVVLVAGAVVGISEVEETAPPRRIQDHVVLVFLRHGIELRLIMRDSSTNLRRAPRAARRR
jgi:hypothetical protein